jgi:hypothetical protein
MVCMPGAHHQKRPAATPDRGVGVMVIAYMSYGMVIIRAEANPPINMNDPSDPMRLLPYLNREQYGERPLHARPQFRRQAHRLKIEEPRYGRDGDRYEWWTKK